MSGSKGTVLMGNGKGGFQDVTVDISGFDTTCDSRGIEQLNKSESIEFLVANNDAAMQCFTIKSHNKTIPLEQNDTYAIIKIDNGTSYRQEFYFGSGYLTQNSGKMQVPNNSVEVVIFNSQNGMRKGLEGPVSK